MFIISFISNNICETVVLGVCKTEKNAVKIGIHYLFDKNKIDLHYCNREMLEIILGPIGQFERTKDGLYQLFGKSVKDSETLQKVCCEFGKKNRDWDTGETIWTLKIEECEYSD